MAGPLPGKAAQAKMLLAASAAMRASALDLLGEAARRAPLDEGTLRAAGHVDPPTGVDTEAGGEISVRVVFDTPYAEVQHERLDFHHTDGEAKYLEQPLKERGERYRAAVAAAIERALRT